MIRNSDNEYAELKVSIALMSDAVTSMINDSIKALTDNDGRIAENVVKRDKDVDELDIKIDEICTRIIALYEPKATDLRYIITALRIITDLERIGDHCKNIAKQTIKLNAMPKIKEYIDLPKMAQAASLMVREAIDAYFAKDEKKALEVINSDSIIDDYQSKITRELITYMTTDAGTIKAAIKLINISRRIERIADHGKNIAELVSYMVTGKILRHSKIEEKDEQHSDS